MASGHWHPGSCSSEADHKDHDHDHHDHDHDHSADKPAGEGFEETLYPVINIDEIWALNEKGEDSAKNPFKPWTERLDITRFVESNDDDPELFIFVPFVSAVNILSMCIVGGPNGSSPSKVKLYTNRDDINFSDAQDLPPSQEVELQENFDASIEYPLRAHKFKNVSVLAMYFCENHGGDNTHITYISFKGQNTHIKRQIVEFVYELRPQMEDHKSSAEEKGSSLIE